MDLALAFGMPDELLARSMSDREYRRWTKYRRKYALPHERMELYLAQICQVIALANGSKTAKLGDYLIELKPPRETEDVDDDDYVDVEEQRKVFDFKPRNKEQT